MTPLFNYIPAVLCLMALVWACLVWVKLQRNYLLGLVAILLVIVVAQFMVAYKVQEQASSIRITLLTTGLLCLLAIYLIERLTIIITEGESWQSKTKADWRSLVDRAPFGYFQKDLNGQYTFANRKFAAWLEQTESSVIGKSDVDLLSDEMAEAQFSSDQQLLTTGEMQESVEEIVQSNGNSIFLHLAKYPRFSEARETIGVQGVLWDVTSHKQDDQDQRIHLSQLRNLQIATHQLAEESETILSAKDPYQLIVKHVTTIGAETLDVERVGIWTFDKLKLELQCIDQYDRSTDSRINDLKFSISGCPAYFAAIKDDNVIDATDARHDPRTHELASRYFSPMGVHSTLTATIRVAGVVRGIIAFEQTTGKRIWTEDEANFAETLASYIAQCLDHSTSSSKSQSSILDN